MARRKPAPPPRPRVARLETLVENTWTKVITRVGVPALLGVAIWLGQQYWSGFLEEIKILHGADATIREEIKGDREQAAATNREVVQTLNDIQRTVGQQQILIQQQYQELKSDGEDRGHRLDKLEDRIFDGRRPMP